MHPLEFCIYDMRTNIFNVLLDLFVNHTVLYVYTDTYFYVIIYFSLRIEMR